MQMKKSTQLLIPFLLTLGPVWLLFFSRAESVVLRFAGIFGALALSLGLILMLSFIYNLQRKIEDLEEEILAQRSSFD